MAKKNAKTEELAVLLNGQVMGRVYQQRQGRLRFRYEPSYMDAGPDIPLSLSMPLLTEEHGHDAIHPFLWGLLPDDEQVLRRWAARFHINARNVFDLLRHVGEDCAGAIQFVQASRIEEATEGGRERLAEEDIVELVQNIRRDPALTRRPHDRGQFSLAGAQAKTALQYRGGHWYMPWGREPTTHILKPPRPDLDGHVENEHFCLRLAATAGLRVPATSIHRFGDLPTIVIERYDRQWNDQYLVRIHQEDACQALGVHPANKYENEGGPGIVQLMDLLDRSARPIEDRRRFMSAIALNYIILGTDAHAKNYALLLGAGGRARLAPFYDIASLLPYDRQRQAERFAMRIDTHYRDYNIQPRHFARMARRCGYPPEDLLAQIRKWSEVLPQQAHEILSSVQAEGIETPVLSSLVSELETRCSRLARLFQTD